MVTQPTDYLSLGRQGVESHTHAAAVHPFHAIEPIAADYPHLPILDGFNWADCLRDIEHGQWYLVVFRSIRRETADADLLTRLDERAYVEAREADGFLVYFRGELTAQRACLSFCLWDSQHHAWNALQGPGHRTAVAIVAEMYESYTLERYLLTKGGDWPGLTLQSPA